MHLNINILLCIFISIQMEIYCKENCYFVDLIYTNWTDDRPRFVVNMTFSNEDGISSTTIINEPVLSPISSLLIEQKVHKEKKRTIYNVTTKLCAMQNIFNSVPLFKPVKENMLKQSNYTFSCPLEKGVYVMNNMRVNPKNPLLGLLYQAKGVFSVKGSLSEELSGEKTALSFDIFFDWQDIKEKLHQKRMNLNYSANHFDFK